MPLAERPWGRIIWPFVVAGIGIAAGFALSVGLSSYFVFLAVSAVTAAIAIMGLGIVTGSAGMMNAAWRARYESERDA
ncbi:hypothetical protein ACF044_12405 [Microbacterium sp. NPDC016588]